MGSLKFKDANYQERLVSIFTDECLEEKAPKSYKLLKELRKTMKYSFEYSMVYKLGENARSCRSIHQNENGYLPYKKDGQAAVSSVSAPGIMNQATLYGQLPGKQTDKGAKTNGQFLEYTFGDMMHEDCRFIVDYRFGFIYMTLGHYNPDSFALLVRSEAEVTFELKPTLPTLETTFEA
jgi:hypothetical protein